MDSKTAQKQENVNYIPQPMINHNQQQSVKKRSGKRISFTNKEDEILKKLVGMYGTKQWRLVASMINGRTPKQCRDRYTNYLIPGFFRGEWSNEEDLLLMNLYSIHGPKWSIIKNFFPNRSSNSIKNRWTYFLCRHCDDKKFVKNDLIDNIEQNNENVKNDFSFNISFQNDKDEQFEKTMAIIQSENDAFDCFQNNFEWSF